MEVWNTQRKYKWTMITINGPKITNGPILKWIIWRHLLDYYDVTINIWTRPMLLYFEYKQINMVHLINREAQYTTEWYSPLIYK